MATSNSKATLLRNGTVLLHSHDDHVEARKTDILIKGSIIAEIGDNITSPANAEVIDCTSKLISPGFIDTHHHVWQSLLEGRHANQTLLQYLPEGNYTSSLHQPEDVFWGQLAGCMEMSDCGTTTVIDFAHMNYSPENNDEAIAATVSSGIRSVYCYCPTPLATSWNPLKIAGDSLAGHVLPTFDSLASRGPWNDGLVTLGFAFDAFHYMPKEQLDHLMARLLQHKIELITFHYVRGAVQAPVSIPAKLNELGILDDRFLVAHSSNLTKDDASLYAKHKVHVSSTPSTELQMSMGVPVAAFRDDLLDLPQCCSLGVDCHSATSSYIPYEARLGLQAARAVYGEQLLQQGKQSKSVHYTVEEAFNLATIRGARAAKMPNKIGSIAVGKAADLVIFSTTSPCMLAAAQQDPVAAIILHSSPADVETVMVGGVVRKSNGKLLPVATDEKTVQWHDVVDQVLKRKQDLDKKIERLDLDDALSKLIDTWHLDRSNVLA